MSCQIKTSGQCQLRNRKTAIFFNCFIANRLSHCWSRCSFVTWIVQFLPFWGDVTISFLALSLLKRQKQKKKTKKRHVHLLMVTLRLFYAPVNLTIFNFFHFLHWLHPVRWDTACERLSLWTNFTTSHVIFCSIQIKLPTQFCENLWSSCRRPSRIG
jgi:hypothetical protein